MNDPKREEIKARIAAAQEREAAQAERSFTERAGDTASEATEKFTAFVKERPLTAAAGGIVLGILVASLFKTPRRAAARGGAKAIGLAAVGAEIASAFAANLLDDAEDIGKSGARRAGNLGESLSDRARSLGRSASNSLHDTADAARSARRETGNALARAIGRR